MPLACVCDNGVDQVDFASDHMILLVTVWGQLKIFSHLYTAALLVKGRIILQNNLEQQFLHTFCADDYLVCML